MSHLARGTFLILDMRYRVFLCNWVCQNWNIEKCGQIQLKFSIFHFWHTIRSNCATNKAILNIACIVCRQKWNFIWCRYNFIFDIRYLSILCLSDAHENENKLSKMIRIKKFSNLDRKYFYWKWKTKKINHNRPRFKSGEEKGGPIENGECFRPRNELTKGNGWD